MGESPVSQQQDSTISAPYMGQRDVESLGISGCDMRSRAGGPSAGVWMSIVRSGPTFQSGFSSHAMRGIRASHGGDAAKP